MIQWNECEALGHWYSGWMLADLVELLEGKTGWIVKLDMSLKTKLDMEVRDNIEGRA